VKRIDSAGRVVETPPRHLLRAIQTPQGFTRELLERAHQLDAPDATDDAALVELLGEPVLVIAGSAEAFKITRLQDLARAEAQLAAQLRRRAENTKPLEGP
jgi:2-C-methyl-D-erythritol 4-phosphate cytidylyltransferase